MNRFSDDYDAFCREMDEEENWKRRRQRERLAWACAGPGSYWYDSAEPYDDDEDEEDEEDDE